MMFTDIKAGDELQFHVPDGQIMSICVVSPNRLCIDCPDMITVKRIIKTQQVKEQEV